MNQSNTIEGMQRLFGTPAWAVAFGLLLASGTAFAQSSYPMLMSVRPVAVQVGAESKVTFHSRYTMLRAYQVLITGEGVTAEVQPPMLKPEEEAKKPELTKMEVKFTVAADALPGVRDVRIVTPTGVSTVGQVVVVRDPVIAETPNNDKPEQAQVVQFPATLCGAIEKAEDIDYFKFHAEAGQSFAFHVRCGRLEDRIHDLQNHGDPILTIRNAAGGVIATSDNYFFADPFLSQKFEQAGDYLLEIRDVRYEGNQYWEYCVEVNSRPFVESIFPLAVRRGEPQQLALVGAQLGALTTATVTLPADRALGNSQIRLPLGSELSNPVPVFVTDLPVVTEASAENNTFDKAQPVNLPAALCGRMDAEADADCYVFHAKAGETYSFEVQARRLQSGLDSYLRLLDAKGQQLAVNDDLRRGIRGSADSFIEHWAAPADGKYILEIRDIHLRGGPQFPYVLEATRSQPRFDLFIDTDKTQIMPGGAAALFVRATRKNGFTGEVQLEIEDLPAGVTATCGKIPANIQDGCIVLEALADARPTAGNIVVRGKATHMLASGQVLPISETAIPYQEIYNPGGGRNQFFVDTHAVCVLGNGDVKAVTLSDYDISLKPGESKKIAITIERNSGFDKNVTLDMLFQHLGSIFGNSLPKGVTLDDKDVKSLLSGSDSQGHLTLKCAADAPPCEPQVACVMANVSLNFVMKATYASKPVRITVVKP